MDGPPRRPWIALIKSLSKEDFERGRVPSRGRGCDMRAGEGLTTEFVDAVARFCFPDTAEMLAKISEARVLWPKKQQPGIGGQDVQIEVKGERAAQLHERRLYDALLKARESQHQ